MPNHPTRKRLLDAASRIITEESLSDLSIDKVTERAGLSRRTFFLHFESKDQLLAAALDHIRPAQVAVYCQWADELPRELAVEQRIEALLRRVIAAISAPEWRGCAFLRISAEFGEWPGHPAHAVAASSHRDMEQWLASELRQGDYKSPEVTARQLSLLVNGLLVMQLVHRSPTYGEAALEMLPSILASGRIPRRS